MGNNAGQTFLEIKGTAKKLLASMEPELKTF